MAALKQPALPQTPTSISELGAWLDMLAARLCLSGERLVRWSIHDNLDVIVMRVLVEVFDKIMTRLQQHFDKSKSLFVKVLTKSCHDFVKVLTNTFDKDAVK